MKRISRWLRHVFGFSRKETNGFIILMPLMMLAIFSMPIYRHFIKTSREHDFTAESRYLDSLVACWEEERYSVAQPVPAGDVAASRAQHPFMFDPNTVSEAALQQLGFSPKIASRIIHYRQKGGRFTAKSDLLTIYGLDSALYKSLYAYINLPDHRHEKEPAPVSGKERPALFDINQADTSALISVYGIGPVLARRVLKYRDALGGFVLKEQIFEVYGLDSTVAQELLKVAYLRSDFNPVKLDVNRASEKELSDHPYISKSVAKAIVAYRFQHGLFQSVRDLQNIHPIDEQMFLKIEPYLVVGQ